MPANAGIQSGTHDPLDSRMRENDNTADFNMEALCFGRGLITFLIEHKPHMIELRCQPSNRLFFGKPFGGRRPASARLPIHSLSSGFATVKVRPAESRQVRPSAIAKTLASERPPSL